MTARGKNCQIFFIGVLLAAIVSQGTHGQQQMSFVTDEIQTMKHAEPMASPTWNYGKQGKDWGDTIQTCNVSYYSEQSPMVMNVSGEAPTYYDWKEDKFSFIPNFQKTQIDQVYNDSLVYNVTLKPASTGSFQGFYAIEPKHHLYKYVRWETTSVQFHYPAEHLWTVVKKNGTNQTVTADLELQIYGKDTLKIGTTCKKSGMSGLSLFFFLSETGSELTDQFFEFTEKGQDFDLSLLVDYETPMHYPIYGYVGTLTQPPCTRSVCWYLVQRAFPITQKQLDYFKVKDVDGNARDAHLGEDIKPFFNKSLFGKNNEIVDPST